MLNPSRSPWLKAQGPLPRLCRRCARPLLMCPVLLPPPPIPLPLTAHPPCPLPPWCSLRRPLGPQPPVPLPLGQERQGAGRPRGSPDKEAEGGGGVCGACCGPRAGQGQVGVCGETGWWLHVHALPTSTQFPKCLGWAAHFLAGVPIRPVEGTIPCNKVGVCGEKGWEGRGGDSSCGRRQEEARCGCRASAGCGTGGDALRSAAQLILHCAC